MDPRTVLLERLTLQRHGLKGGMNCNLLRGGELHPLIRLAVNASCAFSHGCGIVWLL